MNMQFKLCCVSIMLLYKNKLMYFLATGAYTGLAPKAPGTAGSIAAWVLMSLIAITCPLYSLIIGISIALTTSVLGVYISDYAEKKIFHRHDPSEVVIDEVTGMSLALCLFVHRVPAQKDEDRELQVS